MTSMCKTEEGMAKCDPGVNDDKEEEKREEQAEGKPKSVAKHEVDPTLRNKRRRNSSSSQSCSPSRKRVLTEIVNFNAESEERPSQHCILTTGECISILMTRVTALESEIHVLNRELKKRDKKLKKRDKKLKKRDKKLKKRDKELRKRDETHRRELDKRSKAYEQKFKRHEVECCRDLCLLQIKRDREDEQHRIDRLDFLLTDFDAYIKLARKIHSNHPFSMTPKESMTLQNHRRRRPFRSGMLGIFDRQNCKGHCTITSRELREAEDLLVSTPNFVNGIRRLDITRVKKFLETAKWAVDVVEDYVS